jgi:splicing factor 3A subunit 2
MSEKFGKTGGGGQATHQQESIDRRERLRKLALETIDLKKDPYYFRNHVGKVECKLCFTVHPNEGNYLAHTQAKKHQLGLAKRVLVDARERAALEERNALANGGGLSSSSSSSKVQFISIGRPAYKLIKQTDVETKQRGLIISIEYPQIDEGIQPRHRFMTSFEQRVQPPDKNYQYLIFAAQPYETIAFKIPSLQVERTSDKLIQSWDRTTRVFTLQMWFKSSST